MFKRSILAIGVTALLTVSGATQAAANISVGAMYDYIEAAHSQMLKRIRNTGDSTAYVEVQVLEVVYENGKPVEKPMNSESTSKLLASPSRLIIPANGQHATRLVYQGDRSKERYFRVRFIPLMPKANDAFGLSQKEIDADKSVITAGVNILTGYGTFVIAHPEKPAYKWSRSETSDRYQVRNQGNSTIVVDELKLCRGTGGAKQCEPPTKHHVLPGSEWSIEKLPGVYYETTLIEGSRSEAIRLGS